MVFSHGLKTNGNYIMMTNKFAFMVIKAMELFTFRHLKNNKVNNYSLVYVSISSYGNYKLILSADWLYDMRHKEALIELNEILRNTWKNSNNLPMFSISIEKENIGNRDIDELIHLSNSYDTLDNFGNLNVGYFIPTRNILLNSGVNEDGYILKSKILPNFQFKKELFVLFREEKGWRKVIPISFDEDKINFLNEKGIQKINSTKIKLNEISLNKEYCSSVGLFDIYRVEIESKFTTIPFI